jgi:hypothetical protein
MGDTTVLMLSLRKLRSSASCSLALSTLARRID